jgi:hypothetical protein
MFLDNLAVVLGFLTLHDKHNIQCRKIYNSFTLAGKNGRKANYIFRLLCIRKRQVLESRRHSKMKMKIDRNYRRHKIKRKLVVFYVKQ